MTSFVMLLVALVIKVDYFFHDLNFHIAKTNCTPISEGVNSMDIDLQAIISL
jgi:hypothetical protein